MAHESADGALVRAHAEGSPPPDTKDLRFDMTAGPESPWNSSVLEFLALETQKEQMKSRHDLPDRPYEYFLDLVRDKYKRARVSWKRAQPKVNDRDALENPEEVEARLLSSKDRQRAIARIRERRANVSETLYHKFWKLTHDQKYEHRMLTIDETIGCKEQEDAPDVGNWKWLREVVEELGVDGMSSEDSGDEDDIEPVYRPRIMVWRRNLDMELKIIDDEYRRIARMKARRGPRPTPRKRSPANNITTRDPVRGLPFEFYNERWLAKQTDHYVERTLNMSRRAFKWKQLVAVTGQ